MTAPDAFKRALQKPTYQEREKSKKLYKEEAKYWHDEHNSEYKDCMELMRENIELEDTNRKLKASVFWVIIYSVGITALATFTTLALLI